MDVFQLRNRVIDDYARYMRSFIEIRDTEVAQLVKLGWPATIKGRPTDADDGIPLAITIGGVHIHEPDVPSFLSKVVRTLFEAGIVQPQDVPYKSGRVRYLISETPTHDHGRDFIRPVEIEIDGRRYFMEANLSRQGALDLVGRLIASKQASTGPDGG